MNDKQIENEHRLCPDLGLCYEQQILLRIGSLQDGLSLCGPGS